MTGQALEEGGPEGAVFAVGDLDTEDLSIAGGGDPGGDDDRPGHNPPRTRPLRLVASTNT